MSTYKAPPEHRDTASRGILWDMHYLDDLRHDPWGTALSHAGALCDVLAVAEEWNAIPGGLQYRPGAFGAHIEPGDFNAECYAESLGDGSVTVEQANHALRVLDRYLDFVRLAGRDY